MNCPHCGLNNRDGAAFCRRCGHLLLPGCPRCGAAAPADANFCDTCGVPLSPLGWTGIRQGAFVASAPTAVPPPAAHPQPVDLTAVAPAPAVSHAATLTSAADRDTIALERFIPRELLSRLTATRGTSAERRVVTMLFCDIQGSTALAELLDPEEWTEIVNAAFEQMVRPIYKYEGTVARLMGDGLLAFFGAPIAHEDDPRRAILAALAIVEGIRGWRETLPAARDLDVRVGINTGLVVVGAVGSDLRLEYSAIGDAINLAARMEQTAAPGTVQISEDTYRLVAGQFEVEPLGGITVKGKSQPIPAYRVLRRAGVGLRAAPSFRSALVNRRMEWEALERAFDAIGAGRGGIFFLTGDAGLGKTRLIEEAVERLLPAHALGRAYESSAASYEAAQPYALLIRLLRQPLGLMAGDPPSLIREQLAAVALSDDVPIFEALFGVAPTGNGHEPPGDEFARRLDGCLERFWRAQCAAGPLVLALDELQWLDASSADRLAALFHLTESAPILFLCASRRERRSPGWALKETAGRDLPHRLTEVALHPLNDHESRLLLAGLLGEAGARGAADVPDSLATQILEKAEGNPLFLEEVVRHLIERGDLRRDESGAWTTGAPADVLLPESLLALLTARIDRLDEATRRTLQAAAVIGRNFTRGPLAALVDEQEALDRHLVELQRMELIREVSRHPEPGYSFNHSLTHEAVYNTILLKQRRAMHRRVAETLESLNAARLSDVASILAHHFLESEAPDRALPYLMQAAGDALQLHAPAEAVTLYGRALPIALNTPDGGARLIEIYTNRGRALELLSHFVEAKALYEEFEQLALQRGDRVMELEALILRGKLHAIVTPFYDPALGRELMERAMALAEETGNRVAEVRIVWTLVNSYRFDLNSLDKSIAYGERGLALARELELGEELAYLLNDLGDVYGTHGDFDKSYAMLSEASANWRLLGNEAMLADSLTSTAVWESIRGNLRLAIELLSESKSINERIDSPWGMAYCQGVNGMTLSSMGEYGQAVADMTDGLERAKAVSFMGGQIIIYSFLARVYMELGDNATAIELARDGMKVGHEYLPQFAGMCIGRLALAHITRNELDQAAEVLADPLAFLENQQVFVKYDTYLAAVEMALATGDPAEAIRLADEAIPALERIGTGAWLPHFRFARARALAAHGRREEATAEYPAIVASTRAIDMHIGLWRVLGAWAALEEELGRPAAALWAEAAAELDYLAERTYPDALRESLLSQPEAVRIRTVVAVAQAVR